MNLVETAAMLRGKGEFQKVIEIVMREYKNINDGTEVIALREAFLAAKQLGDTMKAKEIALIINSIEPGMPSVQEYLQ